MTLALMVAEWPRREAGSGRKPDQQVPGSKPHQETTMTDLERVANLDAYLATHHKAPDNEQVDREADEPLTFGDLRKVQAQVIGIKEMREDAERTLRIAVWNFLKERGVKDDDCYPRIEGAVTDFRAALNRGNVG